MLISIKVLRLIAQCGIGGAGQAFLAEHACVSLFVVRGLLDKLSEDGAIVRVKGKYFLTLLGNNLVLGYEASLEGYEVSVVKSSEWSYQYQKALF